VFLLYLLAKRLMNKEPTVYRVNDSRCFVFDETYRGANVTAKTLFELGDQSHQINDRIWILTDGKLSDERWSTKNYPWFIVLAASPGLIKESWGWLKERNPRVHYMSNWQWSEIYAAFWS